MCVKRVLCSHYSIFSSYRVVDLLRVVQSSPHTLLTSGCYGLLDTTFISHPEGRGVEVLPDLDLVTAECSMGSEYLAWW